MRIGISLVIVCAIAVVCVSLAPAGTPEQAAKVWKQMRAADVNSPEFTEAKAELEGVIAEVAPKGRVAVAIALMEWGSPDAINAAALQMFGPDGLSVVDLRALLDAQARYRDTKNAYPQQRVLLRTYWRFLRPENETRLTEPARRQLVGTLARHLLTLAKEPKVTYGEQRLASHLIQATLSRYAASNDVPDMMSLRKAMAAYVKAHPRDALSASITAWNAMTPEMSITSTSDAIKALGHWEPLTRMKASAELGTAIVADPSVGELVLKQLDDPRDEVRASAAGVFGFALSYKPSVVIPRMVELLRSDRGVTVQQAASETLIARADDTQTTIGLLLKALRATPSGKKPGPKRTRNLLMTASYLITSKTPTVQKMTLLNVARDRLTYAPQGALHVLEALGDFARPAVEDIKHYRDTVADRLTRQYINRHVLQAIDPNAAKS